MKKILAIGFIVSIIIGSFTFTPASAGTTTVLPLIAGQFSEVGTVTVSTDGNNLTVKYEITENNWYITETHLYVGIQPPSSSAPGKFPYQHPNLSNVSTDTYTIPISTGTTYYIAAHAVVYNELSKQIVGWDCLTVDRLNTLLPASGNIMVQRITYPVNYFDVTITNSGNLDGNYAGWCLDRHHGILQNTTLDTNLFSSYETLPDYLITGEFPTISYPENMDLVNWVINHNDGYTISETQNVIWKLLNMYEYRYHTLTVHEQVLYDESLTHNGFIPDINAGEVPTFIAQPLYPGLIYQSILVELECLPVYQNDSETAWAQGVIGFKTGWGSYFTYVP